MRCLLLVLAAFFVLDGARAHADPILATVDNATMSMGPNRGGGDNILFKFTGRGVDIEGRGGMACFDWCTGVPIAPGTPINLTHIFISSFGKAIVGGVAYDPSSDFGTFGSFFDDAGGLSPSVMGFVGEGETFSEFLIWMPSGDWTLNFTPVRDEQGHDTVAFVNGTFSAGTTTPMPMPTPEPGTLGLMLLGCTGIWVTARRRRSRCFHVQIAREVLGFDIRRETLSKAARYKIVTDQVSINSFASFALLAKSYNLLSFRLNFSPTVASMSSSTPLPIALGRAAGRLDARRGRPRREKRRRPH